MEGIGTADALLSQVYPKAAFEEKDKEREEFVGTDIQKFKMDRLEKLLVPPAPISLMLNHAKKYDTK
jgi:hypothetical protein